MSRSGAIRLALVALGLVMRAGAAQAAEPDAGHAEARAIVDRVAVRFFAPEMGGPAKPRFVTERLLAFEARLEALSDPNVRRQSPYDERRIQSALDRHVAEEILGALYESSDGTAAEDARLSREARADIEQRAGDDAVWVAAEEEGLDTDEVQAFFIRRARAAAYLDRAITRFLHPQDDQLREVYRTSQHPFQHRPYEDVRGALSRWFVFERLKALELTFLQTARSRITIVVVPR